MTGTQKRIASALLALILALSLGVAAAAEEETAREGLLAVVNGAAIPADEAQAEYAYYASLYSAYGLGDQLDALKEDIAVFYVQYYLILNECANLGYDQLTDGELADIDAEAQATYDSMLESYKSYFEDEGLTDEEITQATIDYFDSCDYTVASIAKNLHENVELEKYYAHLTDGVVLTDEQLETYYNALVDEAKAAYEEDSYSFEYDVTYEADIYYVPEGFRSVYHILLLLGDDEQAELTELQFRQDEIAEELAAEDANADALGEELDSIQARIDELCAPLIEKAGEIQARLANGEDFKVLMAEYNEDPGMMQEPFLTNGYYVSADSVMWEDSFRDAAMALEKIGDVSEPVLSSYGIHLILYAADLKPGAVALETVADKISGDALAELKDDVYGEAVQALYDSAEIEFFLDNLVYEEAGDEAVG